MEPTPESPTARGGPVAKAFDLKSYARRGAQVRLRELVEEAKQLLKVFPDLSASFDEDELPVTS